MTTATPPTKSLQQLAADAIAVQDACNMGGVSNSFAAAIRDLNRHCDHQTLAVRQHVITKLWIFKLCDLSSIYCDPSEYSDVWNAVQKLADGE